MKEHYVSYDCTVKLKELGFDWECLHYYNKDGLLFSNSDSDCEGGGIYVENLEISHNKKNNKNIDAPTLAQAQAWLREVKGIHISLNPYSISPDRYDGDNYFWSFELFQVPTGGWLKVNRGGFDTYNLALSAGIDAALELLTNKQTDK